MPLLFQNLTVVLPIKNANMPGRVALAFLEEQEFLGDLIFQCDPESAAYDVMRVIAVEKGKKGMRTRFRKIPKGSKGSNGVVERYIQLIKGLSVLTRAWWRRNTEF